MYTLSICENPDILSAIRYVKIVINIIKIAVPIILIISLMLAFARAVLSNDSDAMNKELKNSVSKIVAAVLIFMVPTLVGLIFDVVETDKSTFINCLEDANSEQIKMAYLIEAQKYIDIANETTLRGDYNIALQKVNKLKDKDDKERLKEELKEIEKKVSDHEEISTSSSVFVAQPGEYIWPVQDRKTSITSCFEKDYVHPKGHGAIDIGGVNAQTDVHASKAGVVIYPKRSNKINHPNIFLSASYINQNGCKDIADSCGNHVSIKHDDGMITTYCHFSPNTITVFEGDHVQQGQVIGKAGTSGCSTGYHVHFAMKKGSTNIDPIKYVTMYNVSNPKFCSY